MATNTKNVELIRRANGIAPLIALLTGTNRELLVNTTRALGRIAEDPDSMTYAQPATFLLPGFEGLDMIAFLSVLLIESSTGTTAFDSYGLY